MPEVPGEQPECRNPGHFIKKFFWFALIGFCVLMLAGPAVGLAAGVLGLAIGLVAAVLSVAIPILPFVAIGWVVAWSYKKNVARLRREEIKKDIREACDQFKQNVQEVCRDKIAPQVEKATQAYHDAVPHVKDAADRAKDGAGRVASFFVETVSGACLGVLLGLVCAGERDRAVYVAAAGLAGAGIGIGIGLSRLQRRIEGEAGSRA